MFVNMKLSIKLDHRNMMGIRFTLVSVLRAISLVLEFKALAAGLTIHIVAFR